jgi:4-hydroxy-2-oxoglutarate aldolase
MLIDGIHVPLTIPFARNSALALNKLESNVHRYSLSPVAGLVAMAPGGEAGGLCDSEYVAMLQAVGRAASEEKVLVAGVAKESVWAALRAAEAATAAGFDAVLVEAPKLVDAEVKVFFDAVADASALPVILWSGERALPVGLVAELARHENVIGLYDAGLNVARYVEISKSCGDVKREVAVTNVFLPATRRMQHANQETGLMPADSLNGGTVTLVAPHKVAVKMRTKMVGFQVMAAGRCAELLPMLEAGVAGAMPQMAACAPQAVYEVYAAYKDGDPALSAEKEERVRMAGALMDDLGVAGVKAACDWNGYYGGLPRLPRLGLTAEARSRVEKVFGEVRN